MYGGHVPYSTTRIRVVLVENIFGTVRLIEYFLKLRHIYWMRYIVIYLRSPEFILHINGFPTRYCFGLFWNYKTCNKRIIFSRRIQSVNRFTDLMIFLEQIYFP